MDPLFEQQSIDAVLAHRMLYTEFNRYQESFEDREATSEQELRSGILLWWATFAPSSFPPALAEEIEALVRRSYREDDHRTYGWHRTVALCGVLAQLTGDWHWLDDPLGNLAHEYSSLRSKTANQVALAITTVPCSAQALVAAVEANFEGWHFHSEETVALFLAAMGSKTEKRQKIVEWCGRFDERAPGYVDLIALRDNGLAKNPLAPRMGLLHRYLGVRLLTASRDRPVQLAGVLGEQAGVDEGAVGAYETWKRLERHPLTRYYVEIADS